MEIKPADDGALNGEIRLALADISPESGHCFIAPVPLITPNERDDGRTGLQLFEDDVELTAGGAMHDDIRNYGEGRFSHWGTTLYFSTSDGSSPLTNGRRYSVRLTRTDLEGQLQSAIEPLEVIPIGDVRLDKGFAHVYRLPPVFHAWLSDNETVSGSRLVLLEDGYPLALPHSNRANIAEFGRGRYRHDGVELRFATSDNTDPATNGRTYSLALGQATDHQFVDPYAGGAVRLDVTLAAPRVDWPVWDDVIGEARPTICVADPDPDLLYYWELDTEPTFDSADLHRQPRTRRGRDGPNLLRVLDREPSFSPQFSPPYRLGAIAPVLVPRNAPQFTAIMAARLGYGLEPGEAELREVYGYLASQIYPVALSTYYQSPETTWLHDRGLCASVSALTSEVLESMGYHTRRAQVDARLLDSERNEVVQQHSSLEVFLNGSWSILDPWYQFYLPEVSYQVLAEARDQKQYFAFVRRPGVGDSFREWTPVYLSDHARGRRYDRFDAWFADFSTPDEERRLFSGEPALIPDPEWSRVWPHPTMRVWVRVRSARILAGDVLSWLAPTQQAVRFRAESIEVSPWTTVSFTIDLAEAYGFGRDE